MTSKHSTVAESNCHLVKDILDRMLYNYWLNQNNRFDDAAARVDFSIFLEQATAELREEQ